ncbi:MAG: N-acetylmuramoyl-L-alanine amidase [Lachnospiraceae bacterium]|nr:N-acetylmuramoyl-L-alanine amidase [Lachnospiraceae bacterium]
MYIRDCGYGRSKRSYGRDYGKRSILVLGVCILLLDIWGIATQVLAGTFAGNPIQETMPPVVSGSDAAYKVTIEAEPLDSITEEAVAEETPQTQEEVMVEREYPLIVIDPGHGGEDNGCSRLNVDEKTINLQIGLALQERLMEMGYEVLMTRADDSYLTLQERVELANAARADAYISIHQNACEEDAVSGIETWYDGRDEDKSSKRLAQLVHKDVLLYTKAQDRELWDTDALYVIREAQMPSCLVETGFLSNTEDRKALLDEEYQARLVEGIASGIDLYFHPKTMYLTFDDGPSAETTCTILDILKERNIKATFFLVGENVRRHPEVAARIVEEGHTIGIHCDKHDYEQLYKSVDSYIEDFEKAYETVYDVTGVRVQLFRFPGGSINSYNKKVYQEIIDEMTARGYIYYDWNASLEDAVTKATPDELIANGVESTLGRRRVVMLAHDIVPNTALCLEALLEQLPEYKMEPLNAEVEPIQF